MRFLATLLTTLGLTTAASQVAVSNNINDVFIRRDVYVFGKYVFDLNKMMARIGKNSFSAIQDCSTKDFACLKIQETEGLDANFIVPWKCGIYKPGTYWRHNDQTTKVYAAYRIIKGGFSYPAYVIGRIKSSIFYLYSPDFGIIGMTSDTDNVIKEMSVVKSNKDIENYFLPIVTFTTLVECKNQF